MSDLAAIAKLCRLNIKEAALDHDSDSMSAIIGIELLQDDLQVALNGVFGDP